MILPPMLARPVPRLTAAFLPATAAVAELHMQLRWLQWLSANDPDEPKLAERWVALYQDGQSKAGTNVYREVFS